MEDSFRAKFLVRVAPPNSDWTPNKDGTPAAPPLEALRFAEVSGLGVVASICDSSV